jgi:hypothetical protein
MSSKKMRQTCQVKLHFSACLPKSVALAPKGGGVSGELGSERRNLATLREPFHLVFANWIPEPEAIVEFTRRYGPLDWEGELADLPEAAGSGFFFLTDLWRERQTEFRKLWETARTNPTMAALEMCFGGHFSVEVEPGRYVLPTNYDGKGGEGKSIWLGPETLWEPTKRGPVASIEARTGWQYLYLLLAFEKLESLRKCENPDCAAPYFIARRRNKVFCSEDCAHLIAARRWWARRGNEWQRERLSKKRTNRRHRRMISRKSL